MKPTASGVAVPGVRKPIKGLVNAPVSSELEKARADVARLKADVAAARRVAENSEASLYKTRRDSKVRLRLTAVLMMTAALIKVMFFPARETEQNQSTQITAVGGTIPLSRVAQRISANNGEVMQALDRLREAFHSLPDEDQVDIVREINAQHPGESMACPLVWTDGTPALYVGKKTGQTPPWITKAINLCAAEVEELRMERGRG
jgi:hypothetical protein